MRGSQMSALPRKGKENPMMITMKKIKNLFLYAGIEREEYNALLPEIREQNRQLLRLFSQLGAVMFLLLYIASMITQGFATVNSTTYMVSGIVMILIFLGVNYLVPKRPRLVTVFVFVFELVLYIFAIHISMLHADKPAVSAVAFLLVTPLLFYDRPSRLCALIAAVVAVFCAIVAYYKQPEVAETDYWNMITFGCVAVAVTVFIMSIKTRFLAQSRQIEYMSQTDLLTGVKNRNHYENRLQQYPEMCAKNLACVYGDVNGLHEVNNRLGHPAGDKMLREVAEAMRQRFGSEHTYRIGGDEFVAFRADAQPEQLSAELDRMRQELDAKGYHVSFGVAVHEKTQDALDMCEIVREAENAMFSEKKEFYSQPEHNRRDRQRL